MRQHRSGRSRRGAIAGTLVAVLVGLTAAAGPSFADSYGDQRAAAEARAAAVARRSQELQASIESLSTDLGQAVLDLQATQMRLPLAQAELATALETFERSQREAALIAARLEDARAQEASITTTIATDQARADDIRAAVGQMARRAYKGETAATGLSVVMDSTSTQDFVDQYGMVSTALRTQTKALDDLDQVAAANKNGQARLAAVKTKVTELKVLADQKVVEADAAKAAAAARKAEIERLITDQAAKQVAIEAMKVQAEADEAAVEAERNSIAAELAAIIAKQRAAAGAAGRAGPTRNLTGALFGNPTVVDPMQVTSEYGMRVNPVSGVYKLHAGIDFATGCGTPEYAARAGTVLWVRPDVDGLGNRIMIDHGFVSGVSLMTAYYHMTRYVVSPGQHVEQGQVVGYSGATGNATGCHLHFEVWENGVTVNPRSSLGL